MGGKKKKKAGAGAGDAAESAAPTTGAAATAGSPISAPAAAAAVPPVTQPWLSNYDSMRVWPITADLHLTLADDSLARKVNMQQQNAAAAASAGGAAAAPKHPAVPRFQFGIYTSRADDAGRRAIALSPIAAGTLLLRERGSPWIAHAAHASKVCHHCAKCLYDPKIDIPTASASASASSISGESASNKKPVSRHLHCSECESVFYCSSACQSLHAAVHSWECPVLQQVDEMSDLAKCNVDLIRAAVKYVVGKAMEAGVAKKEGGGKDAAAASSASTVSVDATAASSTAASSFSSSFPSSSPSSSSEIFDPYHFQSGPSDSDLLVDHLSTVSPQDLRNMLDASALVLKALPPSFADCLPKGGSASSGSSLLPLTPIESVASFMNRLNSNCHGLHFEEYPTIQFGFGLYPLCAIFNHSCYPNCVFINEGADLTFRVIRAVEVHEELTVNYISLYSGRPQRRKELWQTKKFFCQCRRCNCRPKNEEEKLKFQLDPTLGAVACQNKNVGAAGGVASASSSSGGGAAAKCPGSYRINYQMRDAKVEAENARKKKEERQAKLAAAAAAKAAASSASSSSSSSSSSAAPTSSSSTAVDAEIDTSRPNESIPASSSETKEDGGAPPAKTVDAPDVSSDDDDEDDDDDDSPDEFPLLLRPKVTSARCTHCNHTGNREVLHSIQLHALETSEQLLALYASGTKPAAQLRETFEQFLKEQSTLLHPSHAVIFNLLLPLVNLSSACKDFKAKLEYCKRVVHMAESIFPQWFLPLANYYEALSNSYVQCIKQGMVDGVPRKLLQRHRDDAAAVLEKMAKQMAVCRGADHPRTLDAQRKAADMKKMKIQA